MTVVRILSGGAAQSLLRGVEGMLLEQTGRSVEVSFGAVGTMKNRLLAGEVVDVVILTSALVAELARAGIIRPGTITDIGAVETAVATKCDAETARISEGSNLRSALLAADAIYVPDLKQSTAGRHVVGVLERLLIADEVGARLREYPNGAAAMAALADAPERRPIGCTQATEIVATAGVKVVAVLPPGYELATMYTAAVTTSSTAGDAARALLGLLSAEPQADMRRRCGFR